MPLLLVLVFQDARNGFGGGEGPDDEGSEEVELETVSMPAEKMVEVLRSVRAQSASCSC